jgi:carboxyl-terminal processing protease
VNPRPLTVFLAAAGLLSTAVVAEKPGLPDAEEAAYPAIERFIEVLEEVRARHPDADKLGYERLVNHALEGMLGSLDPHSSFLHPEMAELLDAEPEFDGHIPSLGLTIGWRPDGPYLAHLVRDSDDPGLAIGAAIVKIDGDDAAALSPRELVARLRRPAGETTRLKCLPPAASRIEEVDLVHRVVEDRAVAEARVLDGPGPATGYLRLAAFTGAAPREVEAALDDLEDRGMARLILDLRGNPGGSLSATVEILGLLVPPATEVVRVRARDAEPEVLATASRQRRARLYPVAVLVDRRSASASELTAGALQDLDRATVVGETTYGKGSVQQIVPTGGGTALRLTVATYHTPGGGTPHLSGIEPDIAVEISARDREMTDLARRREALPAARAADLEAWSDPVLAAALEALDR